MFKRKRPAKKGSQESNIKDLISSLHDSEKNNSGVNNLASIEPDIEQDRTVELKNLDALATILTGQETCAATLSINKELFVASNKNADYAEQFITLLKTYIEVPFKKEYKALVTKIDEEHLKYEIVALRQPDALSTGNMGNEIERDFLQSIQSGENIKLNCKIVIENQSKESIRKMAVKLLRPEIELRILANSLLQKKEVFDLIATPMLLDKVIYLKDGYMHAEMKILDATHQLQGGKIIGITKLACFPCNTVLDIYNEGNDQNYYTYSGTHGATYPGWHEPLWIRDNDNNKNSLITKLSDAVKYEKHHKTSDSIPYTANAMPPLPPLANFDDLNAIKSQVENLEERVTTEQNNLQELHNERDETNNELSRLKQNIDKTSNQLKKLSTELNFATTRKTSIDRNVNQLEKANASDLMRILKSIDNNLFLSIRGDLGKVNENEKKDFCITKYKEKTEYDELENEIVDLKKNKKSEENELEINKQKLEKYKQDLKQTKENINTLKREIESVDFIKDDTEKALSIFEQYNKLLNSTQGNDMDSPPIIADIPGSDNSSAMEDQILI
ncbi:MAG TPA: hypothetical protein QKA08_03960 [Candidatus Megaira endosymbiont of Nemacystus decipiens]|nr:hypothetical protein [Candidatus Megaera endosymbiont of Nemacystus decipiens]